MKGQWQVVPDEHENEDPHKSRSADLRRVGGLAVVLLVVAASTASNVLDRSSTAHCGVSSPTGAMTLARAGHTATLLRSGKVLVAGGWNWDSPDSPLTSTAEIYDPTTGTWTATGSMRLERAFHGAALLPSGKVLVAGGIAAGGEPIASAEIYDPDSGMWTETSSMSVAADSLTTIVLRSGGVFAAPGLYAAPGMYSSGAFPNAPERTTHAAELYDPVSKTWSVIGGLIEPLGSATLLASGKILVVGGRSDTAQLYDPATGAWSPTVGMITTRERHTATLLRSGKVLVAGGGNFDSSISSSAEIYDPATDRWTPTKPMTALHRDGAEATLLPFGKVLVAGGGGSGGGYAAVDSVDLYDSATARWTASGVMTTPRTFFTGTLLPSGALLFAGGIGVGESLVSSAEIYAPTCR